MKKSTLGVLPTITVVLLFMISSFSSVFGEDEVLIFSVMGDVPYEPADELILQQQIDEHNIYSPSEWMVHVGDMKGIDRDCEEIDYEKTANYLLGLDVPTFIIPGDNEWVDCDDPDQAWSFWSKHFMNFEQNFCGPPAVERQTVRPENFAFVTKGVLIIGLNMVGGTAKSKDPDAWDARLQDNADWVSKQFEEKVSQVRAGVVFGHAIRSNDELFEVQFEELAREFGKPLIYIQGENHSFNHKARFLADNMQKVTVDKGAIALPLQITVNLDPTNPFVINREPWNETSPMLNRGPCGSSANITANPGSHNFGQTTVGTSSTTTIQITNNGGEDFNLTGVRLEGTDSAEFNLDSVPGPMILSPSQVVDVDVSFNPASFGPKGASFTVEGGDPSTQVLTVPITGLGHIEVADGSTPVNYLLAFIADQGDTPDTRDVLQLIKDEGAQAIVHGGDFDYSNDAAGWEGLLNEIVGPDIPVFATLGEDEASKWHDSGGYQERLAARMTALGITWDGDLGVQSSFTYNGIFFIQTSEGVLDGDHDGYLRDKLGAANAVWRISTFHKNMERLQLCGHSDRTGWAVYEESRRGGAIIQNAQCHVYARTHLLSNFENQTVVSTSDTLLLSADDPSTPEDEGRTFDVISGLGGKSRHTQVSDGDWWAATFAKDDPSEYGALFGILNFNGNPSLAKFYFKTVTGEIIDTFYVLSPLSTQHSLTVNKEGDGSVALTPDGGFYEDGDVVTLEATPADGWEFLGWDGNLTGSDNPTSITMDSNKSVTARFNLVAPLISSFAPASAQIGFEVIITGLNFTNPRVFFNGTEALPVVVDSDNQIRVDVPVGAYSGKIRVTNALGSGESATDFNVILPPTLTGFTPDIGPPGTEVTVDGSSLASVNEVAFNGTVATVVTVDSDNRLRVEVPAGAKTGPLRVTNEAGNATSASNFTVTAPPTTISTTSIEDTRVRSSEPTNNYGDQEFLQIRKSTAYHIGYLKFQLNGIFGLVQSAKVRLEVVDGGSDGGSIYLVSNNYEASSEPWTEEGLIWDNAPAISGSALSSAGEVLIGDIVEFDVTAAITGNGTFSFAIRNGNSSRIKYSSKEGGTPPELVVEALTTPMPVINSFTPGAGVATTTTVTFTGVNFTGTSDVLFGGVEASFFNVISDSELHADVPVGATSGKISVTNVDGTGESAEDFVVISAPTITGFSPDRGVVDDEVTITGTHFSAVTEVRFGSTVAADVAIDSDSQLIVNVPSGASTGKLSVTNAAGTATSTDDFTILQPPVIAGFSPLGGPAGTEVTVTGANCLGATSVMFGATPADSFAVDSATELRTWVPSAANTGKIAVTNPDGTGESSAAFTVVDPPVLTDFTPTLGPPGTEVTVTGANFLGSEVFFNGIQATTKTIDSDTQIRAQVPAGASSGNIRIENSAGSATSTSSFTVTAPPSTISLTPIEDSRVRSTRPTTNYGQETFLQVRKSTADHIAYLKFEISSIFGLVQSAMLRLKVDDGGSDGGAIHLVSNNYEGSSEPWTEDGLIWNNAPAISGSALSSVGEVLMGDIVEFDVTAAISGNGTFSFAIRNGNSSRIKYSSKEGGTPPELVIEALTTPVPVITSFTPNTGAIGTKVTLTGMNFTGTTDVVFGSKSVSFTVMSHTKLHADVVDGATSGTISVTNADGTGDSDGDFVVIAPPDIAGFSPASGAVGDEVTITGTHFSTVTQVSLGALVAPIVDIDSDNQLRVEVPDGATTAKLSVINSGGTTASVDDFTVLQPPVISGFSPSTGPVGTEVTVTGANCLGATAVLFGGTPADTFAVASATELRTWVPNGANSGKIGVTNADGSGESSAAFTVVGPPTLTDFTPTLGPPGTEVILTGTSFLGSEVRFNGTLVTVATIDSDTRIRAQVPAGASSGPIGITNSAGEDVSSSDFQITDPPSTLLFTPIEDSYARSDEATTNYGSSSTIHIKESSSSRRRGYLKFEITGLFGVVQSARIRFLVTDDGSHGGSIYPVSNDYEDGSAPWTEGGLTWNNAPAIGSSALSTVAGPVAVDDVVEFDVTAAIAGNGTYSFAIKGDGTDRIKYASKDGARAPEMEINLLTTPLPVITSVTPNSGPIGTIVKLTGVNFTGTTGVLLGSTAATFDVKSDGELHADVPDGASSGKIRVTNADGTGESAGDFVVVHPPSLAGFDPSNGPAGTEVTLTGSGLSGANQVTFNGAVASSTNVISDSEVRAVVPADATTGLISISNSAGSDTSTESFEVPIPAASTTFLPIQDSYAKSDLASNNYGDSNDIRVKNSSSSVMQAYLKFDVSGLVGVIIRATLFLKVTSASDDGGSIYSVSNNYQGSSNPWDESGLDWNNAPEISGSPLSSLGGVNADEVVAFDVTLPISGNGTYSFGIANSSADAAKYNSVQSANPPELVIETGPPPSAPKVNPAVPEVDAQPADELSVDLPEDVAITSVRPNPFNIETVIEYTLPEDSKVSLVVYNIVGQQVRTLVRDRVPAGTHRRRWDGKDDRGRVVGTGVYIIRLQAEGRHFVQRLTLLK